MFCWNFEETEWINPPKKYQVSKDQLIFKTEPNTDFWQRTYYGYQYNNGHALLLRTDEGSFTFTMHAEFSGEKLYDQSGLMIYQDAENWVKAGGENAESLKMLGSVVTNHGYSDWAISSTSSKQNLSIYYRLSRIHDDFLIETSSNGETFTQMRTFHLFEGADAIRFGVYACSPLDSSFEAKFSKFSFTKCIWSQETHI